MVKETPQLAVIGTSRQNDFWLTVASFLTAHKLSPARRWVLSFMWLKFTVVWRFFRLASLAAGTDAPENIRRCFANNYDIEVRE